MGFAHISKINIYYLSDKKNEKDENTEKIPMTFTIKDFQIPLKITEEVLKELLPDGKNSDNPPEHMYM